MLFVARYKIAGLVAHGRNKKGRTAPFGVVRPCCDTFVYAIGALALGVNLDFLHQPCQCKPRGGLNSPLHSEKHCEPLLASHLTKQMLVEC